MSPDAMDIDPAPLSLERKRKNKEKDRHSAKKRKHELSTATAQPDVEAASKAKKKAKKAKQHKDHGFLESSAQALQHTPNPRSKKPKKHAHQSHEAVVNDDQEQEQTSSKRQSQSTTTSRKPLSKASASQFESSFADPTESSPFHLITATLYVPLSPISISPTHALSSLQAEHLSPLLLTYYPPLRGIVLAYSNASISSISPSPTAPPTPDNPDEDLNPQPLTLAVSAGEYGVLYVYLTATFLIFRPERGQPLEGWINVQSDGFLGAVVYNLFSVGIERRRLPADWEWVAPGEESTTSALETTTSKNSSGTDDDDDDNEDKDSDFDSDKENFRPMPATSSAMLDMSTQHQNHEGMEPPFEAFEDAAAGYFRTRSGRRVRGMVRFRVRDVDVIPGAEHDKGFLSIEGTMLNAEEEAKLLEEERRKAGFASLTPSSSAAAAAAAAARAGVGRSGDEVPSRAMMSGGLGTSSAAATAAADDDDVMEMEPEGELPVLVPGKKGKDKEKKKKKKVKKTTS
ncbi:hypothetical protein ACJ73_04361 [Blastomyces percursus]|uniref:DNA-directed RNA polymerase subunit n=1 Tax=Blastomyces percursus TaxID=1658174 RepID=A0A1J9Q724_9EURO|nr:hypothetical protein ACJ73_04361 [Blastomyces percursus]